MMIREFQRNLSDTNGDLRTRFEETSEIIYFELKLVSYLVHY